MNEQNPDRESPDDIEEFWARYNTADAVFAVDSQQHIVHWDSLAQKLLGFRPEDVIGKLCYEVVGGRDSRNFRFCRRNCPVLVNARRGRPTQNYDILCVAATGEEKWLNVSVVVPKKGGGNGQIVHLVRDVTHRRRIENLAKAISATLRPLLNEVPVDSTGNIEPNPIPLPQLSRREMEVLRFLTTGMSTQQIAQTLTIQPVTARNHISNLLTKLGAENRLQAVAYASQHRMI